MMLLETERLQIQFITTKDASFLYRLMNTPKWLEFIGDRNITNETEAKKYIVNSIRPSYAKHDIGTCKIVLKNTQKPIGTCGILQRDYLEYPDLGFAILPEFERKGYAFEASQAVLHYAKTKLELKTILAFANPENKASLGLLKKLNFQDFKTITVAEQQLTLLKKVL